MLPAHTASPSAVMDAHKATTINLWEIKVSGPDQVIIWRSDETLPAFRWEGSELTDEAQSSRIRCRLFTINCLTYGAWKPVYYRPLPSLYLQDKHYAKDLLQKARCQLLIFLISVDERFESYSKGSRDMFNFHTSASEGVQLLLKMPHYPHRYSSIHVRIPTHIACHKGVLGRVSTLKTCSAP